MKSRRNSILTIICYSSFFITIRYISGADVDGINDENLITYYNDLIERQLRTYNSYTDPVNARQFEGNYYNFNVEHKDYGEYDFVVIGGGSSGAVIAARLSEISHWRVLLLEAGEKENNFTNIPGLYFYSRFSSYNWGYISEPQQTACLGMIEQRCPFPRGRGLGGTSLINGLIYSRGHRKDFDEWNTYITNGTWSYNDVLPYFRKSENNHIKNVDGYYHGESGPLPINNHEPMSPQTLAFLNANQELDINITDINGAQQYGAALNQFIIARGQRVSTARAYLAMPRKNLEILTGAYVTKILTRSNQAFAVEFTYQETLRRVRISKEVILSAGVFGSPFILMHSGIGPIQTLHRHGIRLVKHFANIGQNLQDHATFYGLIFNSNYSEPIQSRRNDIKEYLNGKGPYTIAGNLQGISFYKTRLSQTVDVPDIEILFVPSNSTSRVNQRSFRLTNETYNAIWKNTDPTSTFIFYVVLLRPRSMGYITLQSGNPFDYPLINPRFLSDEKDSDIESIYLGVQHVLRMIETFSFRRINATLVKYTFPACKHTRYLSKAYWYCTIRQITMNVYHPIGTCAMKDQSMGGVVDAELKIYGIRKLRVVDVSILPFSLSGHPHATAVMIGEKGADIIKQKYGMLV